MQAGRTVRLLMSGLTSRRLASLHETWEHGCWVTYSGRWGKSRWRGIFVGHDLMMKRQTTLFGTRKHRFGAGTSDGSATYNEGQFTIGSRIEVRPSAGPRLCGKTGTLIGAGYHPRSLRVILDGSKSPITHTLHTLQL